MAFGPYVNTVESNSLLLNGGNFGTDASKAMSWALDCEFVRQTYTNELKCVNHTKRKRMCLPTKSDMRPSRSNRILSMAPMVAPVLFTEASRA